MPKEIWSRPLISPNFLSVFRVQQLFQKVAFKGWFISIQMQAALHLMLYVYVVIFLLYRGLPSLLLHVGDCKSMCMPVYSGFCEASLVVLVYTADFPEPFFRGIRLHFLSISFLMLFLAVILYRSCFCELYGHP